MTVESAFERRRAVFLDSAPVIYTLGLHPEWSRKATTAIGFCIDHNLRILASPVTLAECPAGEADPVEQRRFIDFLLHTPRSTLSPSTR